MMRSNVESWLQAADTTLNNCGIVAEGKVVKSEYERYLSSFGATVINIGIKATIAFYMKDSDHKLILNAIAKILATNQSLTGVCVNQGVDDLKCLVMGITDEMRLHEYTQWIVEASVALKLMIRTYELDKKNSNQKDHG